MESRLHLFRKEFTRPRRAIRNQTYWFANKTTGVTYSADSVGDVASIPLWEANCFPYSYSIYGTRSSQNDIETRRTTRKAVFRFPFEQGRRNARCLEIAERSLLSRDRPKRFGIDRFGNRAFGGERS